MAYRIHSSMLLASFALALAGCGGGDSGPPDTLSGAFLDGIQRNCQKFFDCQASYLPAMHDDVSFADFVGGSSVDECVNTGRTLVLAFRGQDYATKLDASVTADRIRYDANDFDTCFAAVEDATCDQVFEQNGETFIPPAACGTYAVGQVATGSACTLTEDCASVFDLCDETTNTCG